MAKSASQTALQAIEYWRNQKAEGNQKRFTANVNDWDYNDWDMTHTGDHTSYLDLIEDIKHAEDWGHLDGVELEFGTISMQDDAGPYPGRNSERRLLKISQHGQHMVDFSFTGDTEDCEGHPSFGHDVANIWCDGKHFRIPVQTLTSLKMGLQSASTNPAQHQLRREKCRRKLYEIARWDEEALRHVVASPSTVTV